MPVTVRQLKQFLVLSEELHFGRAAERLNISQPPLSTGLKQLETHLGFRLVDRSTKAVQLTPAGAAYAAQVRKILEQLSSAEALGRRLAHGTQGRLSVGFVPSMLLLRFPRLLYEFETLYPSTTLTLNEASTDQQLAMISGHQLDIGFVHASDFPEDVVSTPIIKENLVCCVSKDHRLATRGRMQTRELAGERVLLFDRSYAAQYYDWIESILRARRIAVHTGYVLRNWAGVIALVAQGLGVALVPRSISQSFFADVAFIELEEAVTEHTVFLAWSEQTENPVKDAFLTYVQSHRARLV